MIRSEHININRAALFWTLTGMYMALIFILSSQRGFHLPSLPHNFDKIAHMCIYIPLAFLMYLSLKHSGIRHYVVFAAIALAIIYGISDELHQMLVPGRDAALGDVIADSVGAFIGGLGASYIKK